MYKIIRQPRFQKRVLKLIKGDFSLEKKLIKAVDLLKVNPMHPSLHSHKANVRGQREAWSSRVSGDLRIIWEYADNQIWIIYLLDIGGHSGSGRVYGK
jgi:mRNA-degrading endonuclease YafQ of YafQ-DinJ toxin-antitoxin module